jgi:hypothetical protein
MLKRKDGQEMHDVPGVGFRLTDRELESFNAAAESIKGDFLEVKPIREELDRLEKVQWNRPPREKAFATVTTPEGEWKAYAQLLKPWKSEVLLCQKTGGDEWAVIQRFQPNSPYARAHGDTEILLRGSDRAELMDEYKAQVQHTLRFMARNLVGKAQNVVWEQFPNENPAKVVRAISQHYATAVENSESLKQAEMERQSIRQSRGHGMSI